MDDDGGSCDGVCVGGTCRECRAASDCRGAAGECKRWGCRQNRCSAVADDGATCNGVCIGGACEECRSAADCRGAPGECKRWECSRNACVSVADNRATCDGVCIAGACEECGDASDCSGTEVCMGNRCVNVCGNRRVDFAGECEHTLNNYHCDSSCRERPRGTATAFAPCVTNFGCSANETCVDVPDGPNRTGSFCVPTAAGSSCSDRVPEPWRSRAAVSGSTCFLRCDADGDCPNYNRCYLEPGMTHLCVPK